MIRLTIEVIPYGDEQLAQVVHILEITNTGGKDELSNYVVQTRDATFLIENFDRTRGLLDLTVAAIEKFKEKCKIEKEVE